MPVAPNLNCVQFINVKAENATKCTGFAPNGGVPPMPYGKAVQINQAVVTAINTTAPVAGYYVPQVVGTKTVKNTQVRFRGMSPPHHPSTQMPAILTAIGPDAGRIICDDLQGGLPIIWVPHRRASETEADEGTAGPGEETAGPGEGTAGPGEETAGSGEASADGQ